MRACMYSVVSNSLQSASLQDSSVHCIFQARILEWVAISFSRGSFWPRDGTHISWISCNGRQILYQLCHLGSPYYSIVSLKIRVTVDLWTIWVWTMKHRLLYLHTFFFFQLILRHYRIWGFLNLWLVDSKDMKANDKESKVKCVVDRCP